MKKTIVTMILTSAAFAAHAKSLSDQDINLLTAATKAVAVYKKTGMGGVFSQVNQCYGQLAKQAHPQPKAVEFCVGLDTSGLFIDTAMSSAEGFPRDPRFDDAKTVARVDSMLEEFGISPGVEQSKAYLRDRLPRIQRYTDLAMQ